MLNAQLNRSRRIGAEFECTVPLVGNGTGMDVQRTLASVLNANGISAMARGYSHSAVTSDVAVEYDSSVRGETKYHGIKWLPIEVKTRILNGIDDWEAVVPKTLDVLRYMGARVNASTGHHVHLALPEVIEQPKTIRSLINLVRRIESVVYGLVAPSRRNNSYCGPLGSIPELRNCKTLTDYQRQLYGTRRTSGLNLTHVLDGAPRVEFRYHQGTLDPNKARHWLRFLLQLCEHAVNRNCQSLPEQLVNDRQGFERAMTAIGFRVNSKIYRTVSGELTETSRYLLRRWKHFNGGAPVREPRLSLAADAVEREVA